MSSPWVASFAPNLMDGADLEGAFVQREPLVRRLIAAFADHLTTGSTHHVLLVGSRGLGKSHLAELVAHRLRSNPEIKRRMCMAALPPDLWGSATFLDLMVQILRALRCPPGQGDLPPLDALFELPSTQAEDAAVNQFRARTGGRPTLIQLENADEIFARLKPVELRKLRAWLQNEGHCSLLATAARLFEGVTRHEEPFFGFFQVEHLQPLNPTQAARLVRKYAARHGRADLQAFLGTPRGRARIAAMGHLTGGNHRATLLLAQELTPDGTADLGQPFLRILDHLLPQARTDMGHLSAQQQRIVHALAEAGHPIQVKTLAARCFTTHQTVSSQLKILRALALVASTEVGREAYYELRDPLWGWALVLGSSRSPLPIVALVQAWYDGPSGTADGVPGFPPRIGDLKGWLQARGTEGAMGADALRIAQTLLAEGVADVLPELIRVVGELAQTRGGLGSAHRILTALGAAGTSEASRAPLTLCAEERALARRVAETI